MGKKGKRLKISRGWFSFVLPFSFRYVVLIFITMETVHFRNQETSFVSVDAKVKQIQIIMTMVILAGHRCSSLLLPFVIPLY